MKLPRCLLFTCAVAFAATGVSAAPTPVAFDVMVKQKPKGTVVYQGKTDARGNFATAELDPGTYVVEFRSKNAASFKGRPITVAVRTGKSETSQSTAPGEKFATGVAMNVEVRRAARVSGQIGADAGVEATANSKGPLVSGSVKVMNGKRYVWMPPELGSNMGGKWVPEGSPGVPRANIQRGNRDGLQRMQDHSGQGAVPGG